MKCYECDKTTKADRCPPGWHRNGLKQPLCPTCWAGRYILRAITIPVAGPVDGDWPELRESLKECWRTATRLTNWATRELAKLDIVRTPDMESLPKMKAVYLYGLAQEQGVDIGSDSQSASCILQHADKKYRATRYEAIWLGQRSLANSRYPTPYPVRNDSWSVSHDDGGAVLVSVRLAGRRWKLRLRGGFEFARQLRAVKKLISEQAIAGEMSLYEVRANGGDHRNGTTARDGGGQKVPHRLMCKMVMYLPREPKRNLDGTLYVRTDTDAMLVALDIKGERLWIEHSDQARRWEAEHRRKLNRWSDDQKAEQRPTAKYQSRREAAADKYRRRMDSLCHEVAAHVVRFAARRRYARIEYDDSLQSYVDRFPWAKLRGLIAEKCDERGIQFERSISEKTTGTARNCVIQE